jgi:NADPH2:quinone reductase
MTKAIRIHQPGGPEALRLDDIELPPPGPREVRLRHTAIGLNYVDIYQRSGLYPVPALPATLGVEAAGTVEAVGAEVSEFRPGDRVAYAGHPVGAYAEARLIPAARLIRLPATLAERTIAASLMRGITAHMLLFRVAAVGPGNAVLIHAAAGGLGLILAQWAKRLGATVLGTVGSAAKAELARAHGVDHAILYRESDFVAEVKRVTQGAGVSVAYDGIGGDTLLRTLDCVRPFGTVASIGQTAGPIPPLDVTQLGPRRSLSLARPSVMAYSADPVAYAAAAQAVIAELEAGMKVEIGAEFPLAEAARAHHAMAARETVGSSILVP